MTTNMASSQAWMTEAKNISKQLGLSRRWEEKITVQEALTIRKTEDNVLTDLPWRILQGILFGNYKARDDFLKVFSSSESDEDSMSFQMEELEEGIRYQYDEYCESDDDGKKGISTTDVLSLIFSCCDPFLKQTFARKLFICKLAIPFLNYSLENGKLTLSVWALRTIEINGESVVEKSMPSVAFLRVGMLPEGFSKSKVVNDILNPNNHKAFVNYESPNGGVRRIVTDGIVECSWLFYSKDNENDKCAMVFNLRGDSTIYHEQWNFLCEVSSIVLVFITSKEIQSTERETVKEVIRKSVQLVLVLLIDNDIKGKEKLKKEVQSSLTAIGSENRAKVKLVVNRDKMDNLKSNSKLVEEINRKLMEAFRGSKEISFAEALSKSPFPTDECNTPSKQGRKNAADITKKLAKESLEKRKTLLLPMQEIQWKKYCELNKKLFRACPSDGMTLQKTTEKIKIQMKECRKYHSSYDKSLGKLFRQMLTSMKHDELQFFLKWLSLDLDMLSRKPMSKLRGDYSKKWETLQSIKKEQNKFGKLDAELKDLEMKIVMSDLGNEHFFREIGQRFEATHGNHLNKELHVQTLPSITAMLFKNGYPLEILDGDASGIPLIWFEAVFNELKQLGRHDKVLVVSVLGIQSSGKSTLLNTMFGLEFAVSAGRCTRGAFMQLVPVDKSTGLPFEYILVVDTEGLRAIEIADHRHTHDNELATFAIGIADVTLINVKGENSAEIKDVLEIVVHAFLRMMIAKSTTFKPTCLFLHQNMADSDVQQKMMHQRHMLLKQLDEITKKAAESENVSDIYGFDDIIKYEIKNHIWYLPDPWNGDLKSAPLGTKYSEKLQQVKKCILDTGKEKKSYLSLPDIFLRIKDLWHAILSEDFVFSFRNSLEAHLYIELNSFVNELIWELKKEALSFKDNDITKSITACGTVSELDDCEGKLMNDIKSRLSEKHKILKGKLSEHFEGHSYNNVIAQWKTGKELALQNQLDMLIEEMKRSFKSKKDQVLKQKADSKKNLARLMEKATEVAITYRNQGNFTEEEIKHHFDKFWSENHNTETQIMTVDIEATVQGELSQIYESKHHVLFTKIMEWPEFDFEYGSLKNFLSNQIDKKSFNASRMGKVLAMLPKKDVISYALNRVQKFSEPLETILTSHCKNTSEPIQTEHINEFLIEMKTKLAKFAKKMKSRGITMLEDLDLTLAVRASQFAIRKYEKAQKEYLEKHSLQARLKSSKEDTWQVFKNTVKRSRNEVIAADMFCAKVESFIEEKVLRNISEVIMTEAMADLKHSKFYLLQRVLESLAEEGNFEKYVMYISDSYSFSLRWLQEFCNKRFFSTEGSISRYSQLVSSYKRTLSNEVLRALSTASEKAPESNNLEAWVGLFCDNVDLPISAEDLKLLSQRQTEISYSNLTKIIEKELEDRQGRDAAKILVNHVQQIKWPDDNPFETMMDHIWGCKEVCPFCNEPCSNNNDKHYEEEKRSHTCIKHKPIGARGSYWCGDSKLVTDTCGFAVHANHKFGCSVVGYKCRTVGKCSAEGAESASHPFRKYKDLYPEWDIPPDPTPSAVKYWQWFMATYAKELSNNYEIEEPDIQESWKDITKEQAIRSLKDDYFT